MFRVFRSDWYSKLLSKVDSDYKERIEAFEQTLKQKPFVGKPLGYRFFREKKFNKKRVLFLIYEQQKSVFLVTITGKKAQQHEIDVIKSNLDIYNKEIHKLIDKL